MIRVDMAEDKDLAKLSDGAARLYFHLIPFLTSHGKFSGGPHTIGENIVPLLRWKSKRILGYLAEINNHTSMRVWKQNGRFYVHDITFFKKQDIREDRKGVDRLPNYPGRERMKPIGSGNSIQELLPEVLTDEVPHEVEFEVQREEEGEVELEASPALPSPHSGEGGAAALQENNEGNDKGASNREIPESKMALIRKPKDEDHKKTLEALFGEVFRGSMSRRDAINQAVNMRCLKLSEAEQLFDG